MIRFALATLAEAFAISLFISAVAVWAGVAGGA